MRNTFLVVYPTKRGDGFKVYVQGQPDEHVMDWNGCNYHVLTVRGQPRAGFKTEAEAHAFQKAMPEETKEEELTRAAFSSGTFLGWVY